MVNPLAPDASSLSPELRLLLDLLKPDPGSPPGGGTPPADVDWQLFRSLAMHHRVYPHIYRRLKETGGGRVPEAVMHQLYLDYCRNTFLMLQLSGEMGQVAMLLADNGIPAIFLKGPSLAADLYGDVSLRTSGDLDLLVPIGQLAHAEELLARMGYVKNDYIHSVLNDWKWRHHHITFFHPDKIIKVELHWRLGPAPSSEPAFGELWSRKRRSPLVAGPVYMLGREDQFLFLVTHGARHGWSRLRWLADIARSLEQPPDCGALRTLLQRHRCAHIAGQALLLADRLLGTPIPDGLAALAGSARAGKLAGGAMFYVGRMINLHDGPLPKDVDRHHRRHLFALLTTGQKLLFLVSFLFPIPEDADTLPLPKQLHFLYVPLRPFLWIWRKAAGAAR